MAISKQESTVDSRFRGIVTKAIIRGVEAELAEHRERGHRIRAYLTRRRLNRLLAQAPAEFLESHVRERIVAYTRPVANARGTEVERRSGHERRSGMDRRHGRQAVLGWSTERRAGVDRRLPDDRRSGGSRRRADATGF